LTTCYKIKGRSLGWVSAAAASGGRVQHGRINCYRDLNILIFRAQQIVYY